MTTRSLREAHLCLDSETGLLSVKNVVVVVVVVVVLGVISTKALSFHNGSSSNFAHRLVITLSEITLCPN